MKKVFIVSELSEIFMATSSCFKIAFISSINFPCTANNKS